MLPDFLFPQRDQLLLLDLGESRRRYRADGHGQAALGPEMMVALLYAYNCRNTCHLRPPARLAPVRRDVLPSLASWAYPSEGAD